MDFRTQLEHMIKSRQEFIEKLEPAHIYDPSIPWSDEKEKTFCAILPPLETFMEIPEDIRKEHFFKTILPGDICVGSVSAVQDTGLVITLLCMDQGIKRNLDDLKITGFCPVKELPRYYSHESPIEAFQIRDKIRGMVLDIDQSTRLIISMNPKRIAEINPKLKAGLINDEDIPIHYKKMTNLGSKTYEECLLETPHFTNAGSVEHLCAKLGLKLNSNLSLLNAVNSVQLPQSEMAPQMRKAQLLKLSTKHVAQGVRYFKEDRLSEAMQCYNFALSVDDTNADAYVARGAIYASSSSYRKAIEDLEKALQLEPEHPNAPNYLAQTFLTYGKNLADAKDNETAEDYFKRALRLMPGMQEAKDELNHIVSRSRNRRHNDWEDSGDHSNNKRGPPGQGKSVGSPNAAMVTTKSRLSKLIDEDNERDGDKRAGKSKYLSNRETDSLFQREERLRRSFDDNHESENKRPALKSGHKDLDKIVIVKKEGDKESRSVVYRGDDDRESKRKIIIKRDDYRDDSGPRRVVDRRDKSPDNSRSRSKDSRRRKRSDSEKSEKDESFPWSRWNGYSSSSSNSSRENSRHRRRELKLYRPSPKNGKQPRYRPSPASSRSPDKTANPASTSNSQPKLAADNPKESKDEGLLAKVQARVLAIEQRYKQPESSKSKNWEGRHHVYEGSYNHRGGFRGNRRPRGGMIEGMSGRGRGWVYNKDKMGSQHQNYLRGTYNVSRNRGFRGRGSPRGSSFRRRSRSKSRSRSHDRDRHYRKRSMSSSKSPRNSAVKPKSNISPIESNSKRSVSPSPASSTIKSIQSPPAPPVSSAPSSSAELEVAAIIAKRAAPADTKTSEDNSDTLKHLEMFVQVLKKKREIQSHSSTESDKK